MASNNSNLKGKKMTNATYQRDSRVPSDKAGLRSGARIQVVGRTDNGYLTAKAPEGNKYHVNGYLVLHPENVKEDE